MSEGWSLPAKRAAPPARLDWIGMADGKRLSVRLWLPGLEPGERAPAVLEMIPYRKQDAYRALDEVWGETLAGYGIAYARVDVRGSGDSEGVLTDEYLPSELQDGCDCIAWLAAQPWCSGAVGMRGLSWGGINTLQVAALRPPALRAIMPMGCMGNRYTDDAHYIGGALGHTNLQWGIGFKAVMAGPPDPQVVGEAWEAMWLRRLQATPPILQTWLRRQRYDAYWRRGSIAEDAGAIEVPAYIVAGWQDTYSSPVGALLESLKSPCKALIGPWGHTYPWAARPYGLDWAFEEVRWWEHWLRGIDSGLMDEPRVRLFMPYAAASEVLPQATPGRWIAEAAWPPKVAETALFLGPEGVLADQAPSPSEITYVGDRVVGVCKPEWLDRPPVEQSPDNARSLVFRSAALTDDLEILGAPVLSVRVACDRPVAKLAARLIEETESGAWLVTTGLLNLTHRASHAEPQALVPGEAVEVELPLSLIAHRFRAGSRIVLALSEGLWPLVWPSPEVATLTVSLGQDCRLTLPVREPGEDPPFAIPEIRHQVHPDARAPSTVTEPIEPGLWRLELASPPVPATIAATGASIARGRWEVSEMREGAPDSCVWTHRALQRWSRGDWDCEVEANCRLTATVTHFQLTEGLVARRDGRVVFERETEAQVPRDLL